MSNEPNSRASSRDLHEELAGHLTRLSAGDSPDPCRVERELKRSPVEVTQLVWLRLSNGGELGPYVRKLIDKGSGVGTEWQELWRAQHAGARFSHLPRVVYCDEWQGRLCVLMEYVPGPTLRELVMKTPPVGREELAAGIMPRLCDATSELHEGFPASIIHRDITPSNVICSGSNHDEVVLVDLGIARTWKPGAEADTTHFGTRAYAAPEQFGFGQTDVRSDVYALGLVAFFCLTGHDPTAADRERDFEVPEVPAAWQRIVARAAAFDPDERYATVHELHNAIATTEHLPWSPVDLGKNGVPPAESFAGSSGAPSAGPSMGPDDAGPTRPSSLARSRPKPTAVLKKVWQARNFVVVPVVALVIIASSTCPFQPGFTSKNPFWLDLYGYLVYMNYIVLALGYLAMDKRWLRAHVPFFKKRTPKEVLKIIFVVFIVLTIALFVMVA